MTASRSRIAAVIVIVVSFVALAAFALMARAYEPGRDAVNVPKQSLGLDTTPKLALPIAASTPSSGDVVGGLVAGAPSGNTPTAAPAPGKGKDLAPPSDSPTQAQLAPCELGLEVPQEPAGLANFVPIIPLFGPFSPEAFAFVPAFNAGFPLLGPLVIAGGDGLKQAQPLLDAAVPVVNSLEEQGFNALSPLYGPVRPQVLDGEAQLASLIAPGVEAFASLPGATCFPAALALLF